MDSTPSAQGPYRAACFLVGSILFLITLGGQVTTRVAGMAVPDWPGTFGHNMFVYPWSSMTASMFVFLEHSHRLVASGVGLITLLVSVWVFLTQPKGWARRLAVTASVLVVLQGILGGQRVIQASWVLGLIHGCLAQGYLLVAGSLALVLSRFWKRPGHGDDLARARAKMVWFMTALVLTQTILGALMRHEGPGFLSVPDFPKIYGEWMPAFWDSAVLTKINHYRASKLQWPETTRTLILWQILHRTLGIVALVGILGGAIWSVRSAVTPSWWSRGMVGWVFLAISQVVLGISILWTGRLPEIATAHVLLGASLSLVGCLLGLASWRSTQDLPLAKFAQTTPRKNPKREVSR
jgi:cytochrome c oxidase assembly protein subunit 15